jgi:hypothetical protein
VADHRGREGTGFVLDEIDFSRPAGGLDEGGAGHDERAAGLEEKSAALDERSGGLVEGGAGHDEPGAVLEEMSAALDERAAGLEEKGAALDERSRGLDERAAGQDERLAGPCVDARWRAECPTYFSGKSLRRWAFPGEGRAPVTAPRFETSTGEPNHGETIMARNKLIDSNADTLLLAGLQKHFANTATLSFGGNSHTPAEIQTALSNRTAATAATAAATTAFHNAVAAEQETRSTTQKLVADFRAFALATFGDDLEALSDFGLKPRKKAVRTPETQVTAAQKALATRKARGTKGKRQKAAIKGTVEVPATPPSSTTTPSK